MSATTAVCVDLDGTLLDGSGMTNALVATCTSLAARTDVSPAVMLEASRAGWAEVWREHEALFGLGAMPEARAHRLQWSKAFAQLGLSDEGLLAECLQLHRSHVQASYRLYDDAAPFLEALRAADVGLALVTNGAADPQRDKVETLGLDQWFDVTVISGEVGAAKPDQGIFEHALSALAAKPGDAWHVGDSLHGDVDGANRAGLRSVWINRDNAVSADVTPDLTATTLEGLAPQLF